MSLDKWIKSAEKEEEKKKLKEKKRKSVQKGVQSEGERDQDKRILEPMAEKIKKYQLKCSKKGCNYQKTIVKKGLNEKDTICPRCKSAMKVK
jgi:hypothetical protein